MSLVGATVLFIKPVGASGHCTILIGPVVVIKNTFVSGSIEFEVSWCTNSFK